MNLTNLGLIDLIEGKWEQARKHLSDSLELEPNNSIATSNLGVLFFRDKDYIKAKEYFERSKRINRFALLPRFNIAKCWTKLGEHQKAVEELEGALAIVPDSEIAMVNLIKEYIELKDQANIVRMARVITYRSRNPVSLSNCAVLFKQYNLPQDAEVALRKAKQYAHVK
jgi:Predicted N-acetylglucosaminyl transferase